MEPTPYPNYFWQTDLIHLRPLRPEDAEKKHREWLDTQARRREVIFMDGCYHDEILYGMTFDEFNPSSGNFVK